VTCFGEPNLIVLSYIHTSAGTGIAVFGDQLKQGYMLMLPIPISQERRMRG
jgi:hypothetical protein